MGLYNISSTAATQVDALLTYLGKKILISEGQLRISRWRAFDSEINYNLITSGDADTSNPNIDILPIFQVVGNQGIRAFITEGMTSAGVLLNVPQNSSFIKLMSGNRLIDNPEYNKNPDMTVIFGSSEPTQGRSNVPPIIQNYTITVLLRDSSQAPVQLANVNVYKENLSTQPYIVSTDINGYAIFQNLEAQKTYYIVPQKSNYVFYYPKSALTTVGGSKSYFSSFKLQSNVTVEFGASGGTMNPSSSFDLSGVIISTITNLPLTTSYTAVLSNGTITGSNTADGTYKFQSTPGSQQYSVYFLSNGLSFNPPATAINNLTSSISLSGFATPTFNVVGNVVSDVDIFLNDVLVTLTPAATGMAIDKTVSKGLGDFSFHSLASGSTYNLLAQKDGYVFRNIPYLINTISSSYSNISLSASKIQSIIPPTIYRYLVRPASYSSPIQAVYCENAWFYRSRKWSTIDYYVTYEPSTNGIQYAHIVQSSNWSSLVQYYLRGLYTFNFWTLLRTQDTPIRQYVKKINDSYIIEASIWRTPYNLTLTQKQYDISQGDVLYSTPTIINSSDGQPLTQSQIGNAFSSVNINSIPVAPGVRTFNRQSTINNPQQIILSTQAIHDSYADSILADDLDVNMLTINMLNPTNPGQRKFNIEDPSKFWYKKDYVINDSVLIGEEIVRTPVDNIVNSTVQNTLNITAELLPILVIKELWQKYLDNNLAPLDLSQVLNAGSPLTIVEANWSAPTVNGKPYVFNGFGQEVATIDPSSHSIISITNDWWSRKFQDVPTGFWQVLEATESIRYGRFMFSKNDTTSSDNVKSLYDSSLNISKLKSAAPMGTVPISTNFTALSLSVGGNTKPANIGQIGAAVINNPTNSDVFTVNPTSIGLNPSGAPKSIAQPLSANSPNIAATSILYQSLNSGLNSVANQIQNASNSPVSYLSSKQVIVNITLTKPITTTTYNVKSTPTYQTVTRAVKTEIYIDNYNNYIYNPVNNIGSNSLSANAKIAFNISWDFDTKYQVYWNKILQETTDRKYVHYARIRIRDDSSQTQSTNVAKITSDSDFSSTASPYINFGDEICFVVPMTFGGVIDSNIVPPSNHNVQTINNTSLKVYSRYSDGSHTIDSSNGSPRIINGLDKEYLYIRIVDLGASTQSIAPNVTGLASAMNNNFSNQLRVDILYKLGDATYPAGNPASTSRFTKVLSNYTYSSYLSDISDLETYLNNLDSMADPRKGLWVGTFFGDPNVQMSAPQNWDTKYLPAWSGKFNDMLNKIAALYSTIMDITSGNTVASFDQLLGGMSIGTSQDFVSGGSSTVSTDNSAMANGALNGGQLATGAHFVGGGRGPKNILQ